VATPTNQLKTDILKFLFDHHHFSWIQNTTGIPDKNHGIIRPSRKVGVPDILCALSPFGQLLGIEIKTKNDRPRPEQLGFQKSLQHVGAEMIFVKSFEDFKEQFDELFD
jgi:hypothetical protein